MILTQIEKCPQISAGLQKIIFHKICPAALHLLHAFAQTDGWDVLILVLWGCEQAQKDTNTHTDIKEDKTKT